MQDLRVVIRRDDQNALIGYPIGTWHGYTFPTIDAAVTFGIGSARRGWEAQFEDGTALRMIEEVQMAGKSLYGNKPNVRSKSLYAKPARRERPALYSVPDDTVWLPDGTLVTTMVNGLVIAWDHCGVCAKGAPVCSCSNGITAPNSVRYIALKSTGVANGQRWEDVDTTVKRDTSGSTTFVKTWLDKIPTVTDSPGKSLRKAAPPVHVPSGGKSLRKAIVTQGLEIDTTNIVLSEVDSAAVAQADDLEAQLVKRLSKVARTDSSGKSLTPPRAHKPLRPLPTVRRTLPRKGGR